MSPDDEALRADFAQLAIVRTHDEPWVASPTAGVMRKRLDRVGAAESGRVTSVVRYDPGSRFPEHPHPDGEEILVLGGVFSDVRGDHPAGAYLLNPEGFVHAPYSERGCTLFVKLRQYPGHDRPQVCIHTAERTWEPYGFDGVERLLLYADPTQPESMHLLRIAPHTVLPEIPLTGGEEVFVLEGELRDEHGIHPQGSWIRYPAGFCHTPSTEVGCTLYVKRGHLDRTHGQPTSI